jgi:hypothetical protein
MVLHPLNAQMSIMEGYYDDGQEFTKVNLTYEDEDDYVKDINLLNIIRDLYDKQIILDAKYNVRIVNNMYDYINCYIYKYLQIHEVLEKEHFTYLDVSIYAKIAHILTRNKENQFPSDISIIYLVNDIGVQVLNSPTKDEIIESIRQLIKKQ